MRRFIEAEMGFKVSIAWRSKFILTALLAFTILGCNLELFSSASAPPAAPTATPILTPTPLPTVSANNLALIDAAGLDFAERRVIDVYQRVAHRWLISPRKCCAAASFLR